MSRTWDEIETLLDTDGLEHFVHQEIKPFLIDIPQEDLSKENAPTGMQFPLELLFIMTVVEFFVLSNLVPDNFWGVAAKFLMFPVIFFANIAITLIFFKDRIIGVFLRGQTRFVARSKALLAIAEKNGLDYTPTPGGAPEGLKIIARWPRMPPAFKEIANTIDAYGGLEEAVAIVQKSGLLLGDTQVLGDAEDRAAFLESRNKSQQFEDGFKGERGGVCFEAIEWQEMDSESSHIFHLSLIVQSPSRLQGVTQLRSKGASWPGVQEGHTLNAVNIGSSAFSRRFHLRSSDQVEARLIFNPAVIERILELAHGDDVRAAAFGDHLVIDVAGGDRFNLVDLKTGLWSDDSIRQTFSDIVDLLQLVDAIAHTFMLRCNDDIQDIAARA